MTSGENKFKENVKQRLLASKQFAEELNIQLHLGAAEVGDAFEKQKHNLNVWLIDAEKQLNDLPDISKEKAADLKTRVEALRVQAALGKAEAADKMKEQQTELIKGIQELKTALKEAKHTLGDFAEEAELKLENYQTKFDLFLVQVNLGRAETQDRWKEKRKEIVQKLKELETKLHNEEKLASERLGVFSSEMRDAWSHIKQAFKA